MKCRRCSPKGAFCQNQQKFLPKGSSRYWCHFSLNHDYGRYRIPEIHIPSRIFFNTERESTFSKAHHFGYPAVRFLGEIDFSAEKKGNFEANQNTTKVLKSIYNLIDLQLETFPWLGGVFVGRFEKGRTLFQAGNFSKDPKKWTNSLTKGPPDLVQKSPTQNPFII